MDLPELNDRKAWAQWLYEHAPGYVCDAILGEVTTSTSQLRKYLRVAERQTRTKAERENPLC